MRLNAQIQAKVNQELTKSRLAYNEPIFLCRVFVPTRKILSDNRDLQMHITLPTKVNMPARPHVMFVYRRTSPLSGQHHQGNIYLRVFGESCIAFFSGVHICTF